MYIKKGISVTKNKIKTDNIKYNNKNENLRFFSQ